MNMSEKVGKLGQGLVITHVYFSSFLKYIFAINLQVFVVFLDKSLHCITPK